MKKLLLAVGLLALTALPALAQAGPTVEVVVVRISHVFKGHATIATSAGAGATQVKELDLPVNETKNAATITEATQQTLAPLLQQGYTIQSASGGDGITVMVLTKQK